MGNPRFKSRIEAFEEVDGVMMRMTLNCPNCGAPAKGYQMEKCRYCDSIVDYVAVAMTRQMSRIMRPSSVNLIRELRKGSVKI